MLLREDTYQAQSDLAGYCRTGTLKDLPGLTPNRVDQYRRLVYNIVDDMMESSCPLAHDLLTQEEWDELINDFFSNHACHTSQVWKLGSEFYAYVKEHDLPVKETYPFLPDLLLLEWLETEVHTMPDEEQPAVKEISDRMNEILAVNREYRMIALEYPVHLKKAAEISTEDKGQYFLLLFREPGSGKVQFFNLSPLHVFIIENLKEHSFTLHEILTEAASLFHLALDEQLTAHALSFVQQLHGQQFILGAKT